MNLYEKANYNQFKTIWNKQLFDKVISIDPSPDQRYEVWLLNVLKKQTGYEVKQYLFNKYNLPKEWLKLYLKNMLVNPMFYMEQGQNNLSTFFNNTLNININDPSFNPTLRNFIQNPPIIPQISETFERFIATDEDVLALNRALKIHKWLIDNNNIPSDQANISNIKTIRQLYELTTPYIEQFESNYIASQISEGKDYKVIYKGDNKLLLQIKTWKGSVYWGKGTTWCIAAESNNGKNFFENRYNIMKNGVAISPCIYYIFEQNGKKDKWAFVEGKEVQYRKPNQNILTVEDFLNLPEEIFKVLEGKLLMIDMLKDKLPSEDQNEKIETNFSNWYLVEHKNDSNILESLNVSLEELTKKANIYNKLIEDNFDITNSEIYDIPYKYLPELIDYLDKFNFTISKYNLSKYKLSSTFKGKSTEEIGTKLLKEKGYITLSESKKKKLLKQLLNEFKLY